MLPAKLEQQERLYREVQNYHALQSASSWIHRRDEFGVSDLNVPLGEAAIDAARVRVNACLRGSRFANIEEFEQNISAFLVAFQNQALAIALEMLARYEQLLQREGQRYQTDSGAMALAQALSQIHVRERFDLIAKYERSARELKPDPELHRYIPGELEMKAELQRQGEEARRAAQLALDGMIGAHPLLTSPKLDAERLARASPVELRQLMASFCRDRREDILKTRKSLGEHPELIYKLDALLRTTYKAMGITSDSTYDLIVRDRIRLIKTGEILLSTVIGVMALAAGLLSAGGGGVAVLAMGMSLGLSTGEALKAFKQYEMESAAHGSQLLSDDPSLGWVVLALVGAGLDLATVAAALKVLKPAALAFNESGDLVQFEARLGALPKLRREVRTRVLNAAREEGRNQKAVRQVLPAEPIQGAPGRSLFGKQSKAPTGPLSPKLQEMYLRELESKWFQTKLSAYAKLTRKGPIDWDAIVRMVRTAEFREYATLRETVQSVGYAGYSEGKLILGMSKIIREIPVLGRSAIQHELVHVFQEVSMGMLQKEARFGKLSYLEVLRVETAANLFGSPAVIITTAAFGIAVGKSAVYVFQ